MEDSCPKCGNRNLGKIHINSGMYISYYRDICKVCGYIGWEKRKQG